MIQDIVSRMEHLNDKMLSMRKDLEQGILNEELLLDPKEPDQL